VRGGDEVRKQETRVNLKPKSSHAGKRVGTKKYSAV